MSAGHHPFSPYYKRRCAPRWLKGGKNCQASREATWPWHAIAMRVHAPPLRGQGDSLSPHLAPGSQGVAAGRHGAPLGAAPRPRASQAPLGSASEDGAEPSCLSPSARGAHAGATRPRRRRGPPLLCPVGPVTTPGGARRPPSSTQGRGARRPPQWSAVRPVPPQSRCQPDATGEEEARSSPGLGEGPGDAAGGPVGCQAKPGGSGNAPQHRARPCWGPGPASRGSNARGRSAAAQSGWTEPRPTDGAARHAPVRRGGGRPGLLVSWRDGGAARSIAGSPPRGARGRSLFPQRRGGAWPPRFGALARPRRDAVSGSPHVGGRHNAPVACPRPLKGRGRRAGATPWHPQGRPSGRRRPPACAQGAPGGRGEPRCATG
jgi:hypothetical protein